MSKEASNKTGKKQCVLCGVIHRLFRVVLYPCLFITFFFIPISFIISIPFWILTEKEIVTFSCTIFSKHINYCLNGV